MEQSSGTRRGSEKAGPSRGMHDGQSSESTTPANRSNFPRSDEGRAYPSQYAARGDIERRGSDDKRIDDRIKSRAVNDLGWNWEAERAKMEGSSSSISRTTSGPAYNTGETPSTLASNSVEMGSNGGSGLSASNYNSGLGGVMVGRKSGEMIRPSVSPRSSSKGMATPPRIDTSSGNGLGQVGQSIGHHPSQQPAIPLPSSSAAATFPPDATMAPPPPPQDSKSSQQVQARNPQHQGSSSSQQKEKSRRDQSCDACGRPMTGQFVRALGVVFHLDCFRCRVSVERERECV